MHYSRKICGFFALLVVACAAVLVAPQKASALTVNAEWIDAATIRISGIGFTDADRQYLNDDDLKTLSTSQINTYLQQQALGDYKDSNIIDFIRDGEGVNDYEYVRSNGGCDSRIGFEGNGNGGYDWTLIAVGLNIPGMGCVGHDPDKEAFDEDFTLNIVDFSPSGNSNIYFRWKNENTLVRVDGREGDFVAYDTNQPDKYFRVQEKGQSDEDFVRVINDTTATYNINGKYLRDALDKSKEEILNITGIENKVNPPTDPAAGEAGGASESCESKGGPLGWIMCPAILLLDGGFNWLDTQIEALLDIDKNMYNNAGIKAAWTSIRNVAYNILVPIMLVMVLGTALGFDFISAYTVKRALPRLVAATIFITLSYTICIFFIEIFDDIGQGVLGLLTAPFHDAQGRNVSTLSLADFYSGNLLTGIITGIGFIPGAILLLWLFGGTLLLFIGSAFLVLLLRQILVVALLLVAPLAILAWIFPGNDKLWKSWWGFFSKLLMMFPLIMAIIAVGRIFAFIVWQSDSGGAQGAVLDPLMILGAYMLPYAFIPFTFKFAGGVFATVAGVANDRSKGLFDRQRKSRADKLKRAGSESAVEGKGWPSKLINKSASWAVAPHKNLAYSARGGVLGKDIPFLSARGRRLATGIGGASSEQSEKLFQYLNRHGANDQTYRALGGMYEGMSGATKGELIDKGWATGEKFINEKGEVDYRNMKANRSLRTEKDINAFADILDRKGNTKATEVTAATALRNNASYIASKYADPERNYENITAAAALGLGAHGFFDDVDAAAAGNLMKAEKISTGDAHSAIVQAELAGKGSHPYVKPGYGHVLDAKGNFIAGMSAEGGRAVAAVKSVKSYEWASAKPDAVKRASSAIIEVAGGNDDDAKAMQSIIAQNVNSQTDPDSRKRWAAIADKVFAQYPEGAARSAYIYQLATGYVSGGPPPTGPQPAGGQPPGTTPPGQPPGQPPGTPGGPGTS